MKKVICKFTGKKIKKVMSFGRMPIANEFLKSKNKSQYKYSMDIAFNEQYGLFQLINIPNQKKIFNSNYAFLSSTSNSMDIHFKKISKEIKKKYLKHNNSRILEIGCNDGIFLKNFKRYNHVGIEPSENVYKMSKKKGLNVYNYFFDKNLIKKKNLEKKIDCIFAANVICHIPNLTSLFKSAYQSLKQNGVFIFEEPYLGDMIDKTSYDQIYDEHCYMFSAYSINSLSKKFGLKLFDLKKSPTHGGSMRYYLCKDRSYKISKEVLKVLRNEISKKLHKISSIKKFKKNCKKSKKNLISIVNKVNSENNIIYGYGATSKSTTILNYCNIGKNEIKGIFDTSSTKINKFSPGKKIPIINYKKFDKIKPQYCILFAWNHYKEIFNKEKNKNIKWISHVSKIHFEKKYREKFISK